MNDNRDIMNEEKNIIDAISTFDIVMKDNFY